MREEAGEWCRKRRKEKEDGEEEDDKEPKDEDEEEEDGGSVRRGTDKLRLLLAEIKISWKKYEERVRR